MKEAIAVGGAVLAVFALLVVTALAFADAPARGSMGVWGYFAGARFAQLDVAESQPGVDTLNVKRVVAPRDAWVVVHLDDNGMPGKRVGVTSIPAGENRNVVVTLPPGIAPTESLLAAVHADRGVVGTLEFNMEDKADSPDQPYFVEGKEVAVKVSIE